MAAISATYHGGSGGRAAGASGAYGAPAAASMVNDFLGPEAFAFDPPSRDVAERVEIVMPTFGHFNAIEIPVISGGGVNLSAMYAMHNRWDGREIYARCFYTQATNADAAVVPDIRLRGALRIDLDTLNSSAGITGANITTTCPAAAWALRVSDAVLINVPGSPPPSPALLWVYNWCFGDARTQPVYLLGMGLTYGLA